MVQYMVKRQAAVDVVMNFVLHKTHCFLNQLLMKDGVLWN